MNTYAFIFGSHPKLSFGELERVLRSQSIRAHSLTLEQNIGLLTTQDAVDAPHLITLLGGTIKIVQMLGAFDEETVTEYLFSRVDESSKFHFGFSLYAREAGVSVKQSLKTLQNLGIALKKTLRDDNISCRFVSSHDVALSSVIVHKERLLKNGVEIVILKGKHELTFGATLAVQPFQAWSKRDYGRPARDDKSGMLPPKLARMMLNLAGVQSGVSVIDPFCGSGTVLQEALLLGATRIIGSDISDKAIEDTKENMAWFYESLAKADSPIVARATIMHSDVRDILKKKIVTEGAMDAIVFEGYLGKTTPAKASATRQITELQQLYRDTFSILQKSISQDGTIVAALPFWHFSKSDDLHLPIESLVRGAGLKLVAQYYYRRPQSIVGREILVLEKR